MFAWRGAAVIALVLVAGVLLVSCAVRPPTAGSIDGVARLDALDGAWEGLEEDVRIDWDTHLVPFIEARNQRDASYAIGVVHAHLRLSQMELFRRVSQARLAEMGGPFATEIEEAIRALDLDRAVPGIEANLPDETRVFIEAYVEGINAYRARLGQRPADARTLGIDYDETWTVRDVLSFGRLASVDVNWGRWFVLARLRDEKGYEEFEGRLWDFADRGIPSFGAEMPHDLSMLTDIGRTGSNALVVSGDRSSSGGALMATDPHLGLPQPNIWLALGWRTPERSVVGLTIPCLPFVVVGRNESIAWSGTNMQSSSSILYELPEGWEPTGTRTEPIDVRWWFDAEAEIRESRYGPVITDAELIGDVFDGELAFRWRGHEASEESSAFHRLTAIDSWEAFRESFSTYAVGGQNMLYADASGNIGQIMAVELVPSAARASREVPVDPRDERYVWGTGVPSDELPSAYNPEAGFLVSANNVPTRMEDALVPQGNANDRVARMRDLLSEEKAYTLDDLAEIQLDTYSEASHRACRRIAELAAMEEVLGRDVMRLISAMGHWDGRYERDSVGAVAYQLALDEIIDVLYEDRYGQRILGTMRRAPYVHDFVYEDLVGDGAFAIAQEAVARAARKFDPETAWGDVHRLRLAHPIGNVPVLGWPYVFGEHPQAGSTTTLYKSAHPVGGKQHNTSFGANARVLFDMGTVDSNRLVLLGGQDGWLGSDRLLDQVPIWRRGGTIDFPLSRAGQRARSVRTTELRSTR